MLVFKLINDIDFKKREIIYLSLINKDFYNLYKFHSKPCEFCPNLLEPKTEQLRDRSNFKLFQSEMIQT